ncbi:DUF58 domain-containing protein [Pelagicoccus mobilis]|uniref:DUF58 domain-containing protein n=1 Tax=Pelagicoccus mobilis TaxID=415221 RepID=A0A934VTT1_9BACT|nr:DUF58 domain-containing protein [Pelagicoccus mobilis]MBK1880400.1 DUF58 domain-containing protein [Pelagicoccus mobilis]
MGNKTHRTPTTAKPQDSGLVILRLGITSLVSFLLFHIDFLALTTSALLGTYLASKLIGQMSLSRVAITISTKQLRTQSDAPLQAHLHITNHHRFLPVFHPTVSVREQESLRIQAFQFHGIIPPGQSQTLAIDPSLSQRGLRKLEAFAPRTRFPFALHETTAQTQAITKEIIVWPKPAPLDVDSIFNEPPLFRYNTIGEQVQNTQEIEAARIRDYHPGDPKSQINWKLSAKLDKLTIIEPRDERQERYELHLDTSTLFWPSELAFERMLKQVSTLVSVLLRRKLLQAITIDDLHLPLATHQQRNKFFDTLATLQATKRDPDQPERQRRNHLWILPAPNSQITLASQWKIKPRHSSPT